MSIGMTIAMIVGGLAAIADRLSCSSCAPICRSKVSVAISIRDWPNLMLALTTPLSWPVPDSNDWGWQLGSPSLWGHPDCILPLARGR